MEGSVGVSPSGDTLKHTQRAEAHCALANFSEWRPLFDHIGKICDFLDESIHVGQGMFFVELRGIPCPILLQHQEVRGGPVMVVGVLFQELVAFECDLYSVANLDWFHRIQVARALGQAIFATELQFSCLMVDREMLTNKKEG